MRIKSRHIDYADSSASYLKVRHTQSLPDETQLEDLFTYARETMGVRHVVHKTLSGPRERTSTTLRRTIILGTDFNDRPAWSKLKLLRHELAHVRQQADHGLLFWLRYLTVGWRWAYEVGAERESLRYLAERGWNNAQIKPHIDAFIEGMFTSKVWLLKNLDGYDERELTRAVLWSAVKAGR